MVEQVEPEPHEDEPIDPTALMIGAAEQIAAETRRHPLRTLGIAFGAGWVLGGGVPRFVVRMALVAGVRTAARALLTSDAASELAQRVIGDLRERARSGHNGRAHHTNGRSAH
jgi:hypothetical protein